MTIGPDPMTRKLVMSSRRGMCSAASDREGKGDHTECREGRGDERGEQRPAADLPTDDFVVRVLGMVQVRMLGTRGGRHVLTGLDPLGRLGVLVPDTGGGVL